MHAHHFELSSGVAPQAQLDASIRSKRQKRNSKRSPPRDVIPSTSNLSKEQSSPTPPSPADSAICTTANSPPMQIWQPPEPSDHKVRMKKFLSLLRTHPYNIHGDLYTSTTTSYLLLLTAALMESQSASDPGAVSVVQDHASPDLEMVAESVHECLFVQTRTLEEHLQSLRMLKKVNPAWRVDPFNFTVDLQEGGREAIVWLTSRGTSSVGGEMDDDEGIAKGRWGSGRESVSIVFWRKEPRDGKGVWIMYKHVGIRGPGGGLFPWCGSEEFEGEKEGFCSIGLPGCELM
ncbi:hypothetical protein PRZ48_003160 [Zasmidium cellare]|uniref:Uncharacterized protein n=1 Tax=Zasmidium cellare TaxID=395010 RepID=A0ABR0EUE2_ZASCE|nr:hypothetical protein PRZ48_003160 [Zasmidium cellare]